MKCNNCGTEFAEGIFCPECGTKVENAVPQQILNEKVDEKEVKEIVKEEKQPKKKNTPEAKAKKALILGIVSYILTFTAILSICVPVTSIVGIVYGVKGLHSEKKGRAVAGIIINASWWGLILLGIIIMTI